jgi:hypothetical protein
MRNIILKGLSLEFARLVQSGPNVENGNPRCNLISQIGQFDHLFTIESESIALIKISWVQDRRYLVSM